MAKKEYIERDCIVGSIRKSFDFYYQIPIYPSDRWVQNIVNRVKRIVQELPAADVAPVVHGEWIIKSEIHQMFDEVDEEVYVECPFCKRTYYVPQTYDDEEIIAYAREKYPFCNCGAKMDGHIADVSEPYVGGEREEATP